MELFPELPDTESALSLNKRTSSEACLLDSPSMTPSRLSRSSSTSQLSAHASFTSAVEGGPEIKYGGTPSRLSDGLVPMDALFPLEPVGVTFTAAVTSTPAVSNVAAAHLLSSGSGSPLALRVESPALGLGLAGSHLVEARGASPVAQGSKLERTASPQITFQDLIPGTASYILHRGSAHAATIQFSAHSGSVAPQPGSTTRAACP